MFPSQSLPSCPGERGEERKETSAPLVKISTYLKQSAYDGRKGRLGFLHASKPKLLVGQLVIEVTGHGRKGRTGQTTNLKTVFV